ncbi:MAG: hypothetical protein R8K46_06160 [Mariprofundaceae bacterium]
MIGVEQTGFGEPMAFTVTITGDGSQTTHHVGMSKTIFNQLSGGKCSASRCIEAAFTFLLEREAKEAILGSFDITVISHYFPEFDHKIGEYLPLP